MVTGLRGEMPGRTTGTCQAVPSGRTLADSHRGSAVRRARSPQSKPGASSACPVPGPQ
jgi:hypothetical protein